MLVTHRSHTMTLTQFDDMNKAQRDSSVQALHDSSGSDNEWNVEMLEVKAITLFVHSSWVAQEVRSKWGNDASRSGPQRHLALRNHWVMAVSGSISEAKRVRFIINNWGPYISDMPERQLSNAREFIRRLLKKWRAASTANWSWLTCLLCPSS